jgi:hypothetical protein
LALASQARFWPQPLVDTGPIGTGWSTAADLFADSAAVDDLLAYQKSFTPDLDRKGQAAYAIGEYSHMFAISAAAPFVGFGLVPDLSPHNYALRFDTRPMQHNGRIVQERLPRVRFVNVTVSADSQAFAGHTDVREIVDRATLCERLRRQVEAHFEPLVAALHEKSGLSRSALWRLVGDSLSQRFLDAGERYGRPDSAKAAALAVLKQEGSPLSNRQMHYFDIDIRDDKHPERVLLSRTYRARGGCCRFYTVEGGHLCSSCVLQDAEQRVINIERKLRQRLGLAAPDADTGVANSSAPV